MKTLAELIADPPLVVSWSQVVDFERWDDRQSCVDILFSNIVGVSEGWVEFCPNDEPPEKQEILAWIWAIRPDLSQEILESAPSSVLRSLIIGYQKGDLDSWWSEMTKS